MPRRRRHLIGALALDPQLERDTAMVGDLPLARVLLMNDAGFPWPAVRATSLDERAYPPGRWTAGGVSFDKPTWELLPEL
jgi:hypothetical protein